MSHVYLPSRREALPDIPVWLCRADPDLTVQAACLVVDGVSGVELNCGYSKPFSTHLGMGAALLTDPDFLCSTPTALRREPLASLSQQI